MLSMKGVILLLLVCAVISPHPVIGKNPICTHANMIEIVRKCEKFIRVQRPVPTFLCTPNSPCCEAVRKARDRDMHCVYFLIGLDKQRVKLYMISARQCHLVRRLLLVARFWCDWSKPILANGV
uniref:Bifunctional inhibitor/plant lipid transfer protein/seed storage helical domain-containing protein n=1 Tax=Oryza glumipatula TaxID=40148 RepID=A0A0D9ZWE0_9ORYZ